MNFKTNVFLLMKLYYTLWSTLTDVIYTCLVIKSNKTKNCNKEEMRRKKKLQQGPTLLYKMIFVLCSNS